MKHVLTYIAELVALAIILWIIWRYVVPIVKTAMNKQLDVIESEMNQADETKLQLAEAEAEYEKAVAEAATQAAQIRENARAEAQRTEEETRIAAQEESARIVARGEEQLTNQRGTAVRQLRGEIGSLAADLSEKLVTDLLSDEAAARASVDALLADLEARDGAGNPA